MRQLWDGKISADVDSISPELLAIYGQICGWTLARAYARSGGAIALGSYLGTSDSFDRAVTDFAAALPTGTQPTMKPW
jgi:sugar/nucleoside kinase (ribokinase family)